MKRLIRILDIVLFIFVVIAILLRTHWLDPIIFPLISSLTAHTIRSSWPAWIDRISLAVLFVASVVWIYIHLKSQIVTWFKAYPLKYFQGLVEMRNHFYGTQTIKKEWRFSWKDGVILLSFLLYGMLLFLSDIQGGYPNPMLASDAANIASFAAAAENPTLFQKDELLSDEQNLKSYTTINLPILNGLKQIGGNYGMAFAILIPLQAFINLVGFYILGLVILRHRIWATVLAFVLALPFEINLSETWGISLDPVSRFTFQALLPYLLVCVILWKRKPRLWPLLMITSGLLAFVHPVSTPAWVFAIWLGLWVLIPEKWSLRNRWMVMIGLGVVAVVALVPYAAMYLSGHVQTQKPNYDILMTTIQEDFPPNIIDVPAALADFIRILWSVGLLPVTVIAGGILLFLKWHDRDSLNLILLWGAGIFFVSVIIPLVEHAIEIHFHIAPLETEMVRGIRYLVFIMLLLTVWGSAEIVRVTVKKWRWIPITCVTALVIGWGLQSDMQVLRFSQLFECFKQGRIVCVVESDEAQAVRAVRDLTPPGSAIFTTFSNSSKMSYSLPIRYEALRSLVYSYKDRGQLVISNSPRLDQWAERRSIVATITRKDLSPVEKIIRYRAYVRDWQTEYILADFQVDPGQLEANGMQVVYQNPGYTLIRIR